MGKITSILVKSGSVGEYDTYLNNICIAEEAKGRIIAATNCSFVNMKNVFFCDSGNLKDLMVSKINTPTIIVASVCSMSDDCSIIVLYH